MSAVEVSRARADRALELSPRVALRSEPFGALCYHYDTRRLVFLKDRDLVRVVETLRSHESLTATFDACAIADSRRTAFAQAVAALIESEVVRERADG